MSWRRPVHWQPESRCRNCGERGKHFVPPSLGERGFFTCKPKAETAEARK